MYKYKTEQTLPVSLQEAWDFFSSPMNLSKITPPELDFKILTQLNGEEISRGMTIDYTVRPLLGIPVRWQTEIGEVRAQNYFTDRQVKGPYKLWVHNHRFTEVAGGVQVKDEVLYELPLGLLGKFIHKFLVRKKIENIFEYRKKILQKIFH